MAIFSTYLSPAIGSQNLIRLSQNIIDALKPHVAQFDTIVFRGVSGALFGPTVAMALNKGILVIRKPDGNHSHLPAEGTVCTKSYVVIDDFIYRGGTLRAIVNAVDEAKNHHELQYFSHIRLSEAKEPATCFGVVLYLRDVDDNASEMQSNLDLIMNITGNDDIKLFGVREGNSKPITYNSQAELFMV